MAVNITGGALEFSAVLDSSQLTTAVKKIEDQLRSLTTTASSEANAIQSLVQKTTSAITAYAAFTAASNFVGDIVRVRGEFQQLEVAFNTMLQSKEKADKLLAQAVELAAKTPFTLQEVGTGAKQLLAYGFAADTVTKNLTTLGNIAAGVGAPLGDIVYLYGTLRTQGRAYTRDILQFTSRGIPIISELAKQFGVTEENVQKLVEGGKVGFPEVERAFNSLTGSGGIFFNLMQEQSKTLTGLISNLSDAWSRMLNDIGKSNQNLFTDAIKGAISLVDNYKEVIKILEILVIAYGSYRAAIIANNVAMAVQAGITTGLTASQSLYAIAVSLSDKVTRAFNATLLSNPAGAAVAGILALAGAIAVLKETTIKAKSSAELLGDAEKKIGEGLAEQQAKITQFQAVLKAGNLNEKERLDLYNKINAVSPQLVQGLNAQTLSYGALTKNVAAYLDQLKNKLRLEANSEAILASSKQENALQDQVDKFSAAVQKIKDQLAKTKDTVSTSGVPSLFTALKIELSQAEAQLTKANQEFAKQHKITQEIADKGVAQAKKTQDETPKISKTHKQLIDETQSLEVLAALRKNLLEEYEKTNDATQRKILAADLAYADKRKAALDIFGTAKKDAKELQAEETKITAILEKRKGILEDIDALQRGAKQSGLIKEQSEIDKVNEKYDIAIKKIEEFNQKAAEFNKKNPGAKVAAIGLTDIADINKARLTEITNVQLKADAVAFKKSLEDQQGIFAQFEEAKKELGIEKAREMYAEQTKGFDTYIKFLEAEAAKIIPKVFAGTANIGDNEKLIELGKKLTAARQAERDADFEKQKQDFKELLNLSQTNQLKRAEIEKKYNNLFAILAKDRGRISADEFAARVKQLEASKKEELDVITKNELEKSDAYKKFEKGFSNIGITATRGILKGLKDLRDQMKLMGKDISEVDKAIKTTTLALNQKSVSGIRDAASLLRGAFKDLNLQVAGQLKITASQIGDALDNVATLLSKDSSKGQQVGSIIGLISFVVVGIRDALLTAKDLADPLQVQKDYYSKISNEIASANELLLRQKNILNDLVGIQKIQLSANFLDNLTKQQDLALKSLQDFKLNVINASKEIFVDPVFHTEVGTGGINALASIFLWGGQEKRKLKLDLQIIDTSQLHTIEEFSNLLNEIKRGGGKLNGKVVVEEDIKSLQALIDNYDQLVAQQREFKAQFQQLLTGTTAASITDSIADGFSNGLRSAKDFATTFEDLMKNAILQSLKFQTLEGPLKAFYEDFASFSASDDALTEDEIRQLRANFTGIIDAAGKKFDELQKITKIDFATTGKAGNSLSGAIKVISEQQADLLAGQVGGLRLTAGQQLAMSSQHLNVLNAIQSNTAFMIPMYQLWQRMELNGVKIKP